MSTPLIIAHQGASRDAPGNTLAAFRLGMEQGADGVELDVHLSADGVPVIIHDDTLDRTTDGTGRVADHTVWELQQYDAGSWLDPRFAGETIPTLDEVFEALPGALVHVELKSTALFNNDLEERTLAVIRAHNAERDVVVSSFNPLALARMHALAPDLALAIAFDPIHSLPLRRAWLHSMLNLHALHPFHTMYNARHMAWAHRRGLKVNVWTVDEPAEMRRLIALGVDSIFTNVPKVLHEIVRESSGAGL